MISLVEIAIGLCTRALFVRGRFEHPHAWPTLPKSRLTRWGFIQRCVRGGSLFWTYHVSMRLLARSLTRDQIVGAVDSYRVIESYPNDKYLPSYLILGHDAIGALHVVFATDLSRDNVRVVTAYRPDPAEWDAAFEKRTTP